MRNSIILKPEGAIDAAVVLLHGLGADGNDFVNIVPSLGLGPLRVKFVFPHAVRRPVTINGGGIMRAWYDIYSFDLGQEDTAGVIASKDRIVSIIDELRQEGIPSNKIFLAGFSQGGAIALYTGLTYKERLAGIIALSTYLPLQIKLQEYLDVNKLNIDIFWGHGVQDMVVPFALGKKAMGFLQKYMDINIDFYSYDIAHTVCDREVIEIGTWMCTRIQR